jgi:hypothetical protein
MNEINMEDVGGKVCEPLGATDSHDSKIVPPKIANENGHSQGMNKEDPSKPDFLPDKCSIDGTVDLAKLVSEAKNCCAALSQHQQDIPSSEDSHDLKKLGMPRGMEKPYGAFAHRSRLSQCQADQIFGEDGAKPSREIEEFRKAEHAAVEKQNNAKYIDKQTELFGDREKVKQTVERTRRLFASMKSRGLVDYDLAHFQNPTFKNATSRKGFEKIPNLIDSISNDATMNAHGNGAPTDGQYSGLDRDAIARDIKSQRHRAKYQADHDAIYRILDDVKLP